MTEGKDVLSWDLFLEGFSKRKRFPPTEFELYDRLVAATRNFFCVVGVGAFRPGYLLVISKKLLPSMASLPDNSYDEFAWFLHTLRNMLEKVYGSRVAIFEHGMCACVGGLDRAHVHLMPLSRGVSDPEICGAIDAALLHRRAGVEGVVYDGYRFVNIDDIRQILESAEPDDYTLEGVQLSFDSLHSSYPIQGYPENLVNHVMSGGHYVYFDSDSLGSSFLTTADMNTQLGREIVFRASLANDTDLATYHQKVFRKNPHAALWRWQEFAFIENILKTLADVAVELESLETNDQALQYDYKNFASTANMSRN